MDFSNVFSVVAAADDERNERIGGNRARIAAVNRAKSQFGRYISKESDPEAREVKIDHVKLEILAMVKEACTEHGFDGKENVQSVLTEVMENLRTASDYSTYICGECDAARDSKDDISGTKHGSDSCEGRWFAESPDHPSNKDKEASVRSAAGAFCDDCKKWGDGCECSGDAESTDDDETDATKKEAAEEHAKGCQCKKCIGPDATPKGANTSHPNGCKCGLCDFGHDLSKSFSLGGKTADVATGDTYTQERVDVAKDTLPETDKKSADGLKAIDVPSKRNPSETQDLTDRPDVTNTFDPATSEVAKTIDADKPIGSEQVGDRTDTFSTPSGQGSAVTTSSWRVEEVG